MHTEAQIRKAVRILVEKYGELTTTELKKCMAEAIDYDDEDKQISTVRTGEMKILQRIGNIISHQKTKKKIYAEGFLVIKRDGSSRSDETLFKAINGFGANAKEISSTEIGKRKLQSKKLSGTSFKKIDWDAVNERRTIVGAKGEEFVYEMERDNARKISNSLCERVLHLSEKQGDGFGYDILSVDKHGNSVRIEVKTTEKGEDTPFYMSRNEYAFFKENKNDPNVKLYRVYNFDVAGKHGQITIISAKNLIENYKFDPVSYIVTKK